MNRKKSKEMFILFMGCLMCCMALCVMGCIGNRPCQKAGCVSVGGEKIVVVPGCGGITTSGWGCNTSCWPQSFGCYTSKYGCQSCGAGCYNQYYGSKGCIGCGNTSKGNYVAFAVGTREVGFGFGCGDCDGCVVGCDRYNGCGAVSLNPATLS